jgi:hypothetical protein
LQGIRGLLSHFLQILGDKNAYLYIIINVLRVVQGRLISLEARLILHRAEAIVRPYSIFFGALWNKGLLLISACETPIPMSETPIWHDAEDVFAEIEASLAR